MKYQQIILLLIKIRVFFILSTFVTAQHLNLDLQKQAFLKVTCYEIVFV